MNINLLQKALDEYNRQESAADIKNIFYEDFGEYPDQSYVDHPICICGGYAYFYYEILDDVSHSWSIKLLCPECLKMYTIGVILVFSRTNKPKNNLYYLGRILLNPWTHEHECGE